MGESINNVEAENKFPLLDIVDEIWYGAWVCQRRTTQRQNQIGLRRGWKEEGKGWDWGMCWSFMFSKGLEGCSTGAWGLIEGRKK